MLPLTIHRIELHRIFTQQADETECGWWTGSSLRVDLLEHAFGRRFEIRFHECAEVSGSIITGSDGRLVTLSDLVHDILAKISELVTPLTEIIHGEGFLFALRILTDSGHVACHESTIVIPIRSEWVDGELIIIVGFDGELPGTIGIDEPIPGGYPPCHILVSACPGRGEAITNMPHHPSLQRPIEGTGGQQLLHGFGLLLPLLPPDQSDQSILVDVLVGDPRLGTVSLTQSLGGGFGESCHQTCLDQFVAVVG